MGQLAFTVVSNYTIDCPLEIPGGLCYQTHPILHFEWNGCVTEGENNETVNFENGPGNLFTHSSPLIRLLAREVASFLFFQGGFILHYYMQWTPSNLGHP